MNKPDTVTISAAGKSVTMTSEQLKDAANGVSNNGGGSNSQKLITDYIGELVKQHDAMDAACEPFEGAIEDILAQAKANRVDTDALKEAVKFKRASDAKKKKMSDKAKNTELYLSFLQLSLF